MSSPVEADLIESIMTSKVETVKPTESLKNALKKIVARNVGSVVVTENEPVGILTERDISRCMAKEIGALKRQVKNVMSSPLITVEPTESIQDALTLMLKHGVRRLPVVKQRRLVGIVSERDVLRWVLKVTYEPQIPPEIKEILEQPVHSKN
jgi:CBS domain-containing protein